MSCREHRVGVGRAEGTYPGGEREDKLFRASSSRSRISKAHMDLAIVTYSHEARFCLFTDPWPRSELLSLPNKYYMNNLLL